jgi:transcriptional regulator with XRE-family HTH domain
MKKHEPRSINSVDKYIGERVRAGRNAANLSQTELGAALNISFQQIQKYERGVNRVTCSKLVQIAAALRLDVGWFFEGCPGLLHVSKNNSAALSVTQFFQELGAAFLAEHFVRLEPKYRHIVRQLASSL